jgi:heme exporter protein C
MIKWWKILAIILVSGSAVAGLLIPVPRMPILNETIRNLFFHVPMWFAMMYLLIASLILSIKYLRNNELNTDAAASANAQVGILFGVLGIITGSLWAKYTWGTWWTNDVKLNGAAATLFVYTAYYLLRTAIEDETRRARLSAVYSIFAFSIMIVLLWVLPRLQSSDSLHPGNGGNPAFKQYDLDNNMRLVFYPAVIGWILVAAWIAEIQTKINKLSQQ